MYTVYVSSVLLTFSFLCKWIEQKICPIFIVHKFDLYAQKIKNTHTICQWLGFVNEKVRGGYLGCIFAAQCNTLFLNPLRQVHNIHKLIALQVYHTTVVRINLSSIPVTSLRCDTSIFTHIVNLPLDWNNHSYFHAMFIPYNSSKSLLTFTSHKKIVYN